MQQGDGGGFKRNEVMLLFRPSLPIHLSSLLTSSAVTHEHKRASTGRKQSKGRLKNPWLSDVTSYKTSQREGQRRCGHCLSSFSHHFLQAGPVQSITTVQHPCSWDLSLSSGPLPQPVVVGSIPQLQQALLCCVAHPYAHDFKDIRYLMSFICMSVIPFKWSSDLFS